MHSRKFIQRFSFFASVIGVIQGVLWILGSSFSLLLYYNVIIVDYQQACIPQAILSILASKDDPTIVVFAYVYEVISIIICLISGVTIQTILSNSQELTPKLHILWVIFMIILSVLDVDLASFLARDMAAKVNSNEETIAYTILIAVSVRVVIVWIINIVSTGFMISIAVQLIRKTHQPQDNFINAFEETSGKDSKGISHNPLAKPVPDVSTISRRLSYRLFSGSQENFSMNSKFFETLKESEDNSIYKGNLNDIEPIDSVPRNNSFEPHAGVEEHLKKSNYDNSASDPDYPYIPPPDYPLGSVRSPQTKSFIFNNQNRNEVSTFF